MPEKDIIGELEEAKQILYGLKGIKKRESELNAYRTELDQRKEALETNERNLAQMMKDIENMSRDSEAKLQKEKESLEEKRKEYAEREAKLKQAEEELAKGKADYEDKQKKFAEWDHARQQERQDMKSEKDLLASKSKKLKRREEEAQVREESLAERERDADTLYASFETVVRTVLGESVLSTTVDFFLESRGMVEGYLKEHGCVVKQRKQGTEITDEDKKGSCVVLNLTGVRAEYTTMNPVTLVYLNMLKQREKAKMSEDLKANMEAALTAAGVENSEPADVPKERD